MTHDIDWHWIPGKEGEKGKLIGSKAVTFFAPSTKAFRDLPKKLQFFLFSPFGHRALRKLLAFHVVPNYIFHTGMGNVSIFEVHILILPTLRLCPQRL